MAEVSLTYRPMQVGEEGLVAALVNEVFAAVIAPQYPAEGQAEFYAYASPDLFAERARTDHFVLVAEVAGTILGMIEVRGCGHISLLFVALPYQGRGIARELLARALALCREQGRAPRAVTVNSSPNAVGAYARLGFQPAGGEQMVNGIRFTPMVLREGE